MGVMTWKKEFYSAIKGVKKGIPAIEHSIKKWKGLSKENLAKHGLTLSPMHYFICKLDEANSWDADEKLSVGCDNCALCRTSKYADGSFMKCAVCPIQIHNGISCHSAFTKWMTTGNVKPMLKLLEKTLKLEQEKHL